MPPARKVTRLPDHTAPEPPRPLGSEGRKFWDRVWGLRKNWIDTAVDLDHVALLCESMDERMGLRIAVLRDGSWRDRVALRALDAQIAALMASLALNPTDRKALSVGGEARGKLAELRAARDS
jgi:hypothetical protein